MKKKIIIIAGIVVVVALACVGFFMFENKISEETSKISIEEEIKIEQPKIEIFSGEDRPFAVMLDNNKNAWPHASINKAYLAYEIIVEGGESRIMALFKGVDADSIGPIRSSRHYFLDYALENDAIYAHLGWSPQAQSDISTLGVNNINGQAYDSGKAKTSAALFWRSTDKAKPHNAYTNIECLREISEKLKYRTTSDKESVLNYVVGEVEFENNELAINANSVTIPYASSNKIKYVYNSETKMYEKYSKGKLQKDETTGETVVTKNIIITKAANYTLNDGENKGRQGLNNIGSLEGYYITNGKAISITCKKDSREGQTQYLDSNGKEIEVNDGKTFINICPIDANVVIE